MGIARILLIEDSPTYDDLATILLEGIGYRVLHTSTAEDGLRMASEAAPELILMDINLPGMDGFSAVRMLRQNPLTRHIPTVAMTAAEIWSDEEVANAKVAGFDDYVTKPIDRGAFRSLVGRFLSPGEETP